MDINKYILLPKHVEGFEMRSREFTPQEISEMFSMEEVNKAFEGGSTLMYKGNEYYVDAL